MYNIMNATHPLDKNRKSGAERSKIVICIVDCACTVRVYVNVSLLDAEFLRIYIFLFSLKVQF